MISTGIIFALITTLSWSIGIFPFTQAARRLGTNPLNHFRLVLATILIGSACLFINASGFVSLFSANHITSWLWLGLSGIIGLTIGDYFAFEMYAILGARTGSVLTTFSPAAALILGALIIDERISAAGVTGIIITIIGVNFISLGKKERSKITNLGHGTVTWGIITGILAAFCQGAGLVLAKKGFMVESSMGTELNPFFATFMRLLIAMGSLHLYSLIRGEIKAVYLPVRENRNQGISHAIAGTIFGPTCGVLMSLYTITLLDPSVAQTIFSLVPAFAMFLSAIFLKDKISAASLVGVFVALAGVVILIWREKIHDLLSML
jgi:drug/metabolite transporter (DMT)-like permease